MRVINGLLIVTIAACAPPAVAQYAQPSDQPQAGYDRLEQYLWEGAARQNTPDGYRTYLRRYPQGPHADQARDQLDRFAGRPPAQPYQEPTPYPQPTPYQRQLTPGYSPAAVPQAETQPAPVEPVLPPESETTLPPPATATAAAPPAVTPPVPVATMPTPVVAAASQPAAKGSPLFLCRPVFAGGTPPFEQAGEAEIAAYFQALKVNSVAAYDAYLKAHPTGVFAPAVKELIATREGRAKALAATPVPGPVQAHARSAVTITPADYPQGVAAGGSATAVWEVAEDGCVQYCRIEKSSGNPALDAATCRTLSARGSYDPARDSAGKPIRSIESGTFSWTAVAK